MCCTEMVGAEMNGAEMVKYGMCSGVALKKMLQKMGWLLFNERELKDGNVLRKIEGIC